MLRAFRLLISAVSAACACSPSIQPPSSCRPGAQVGYRQVSWQEWPSSELSRLTDTVRAGRVTLVLYDGCRVRPLWQCTQNFGYEFVADRNTPTQAAPNPAAPEGGSFVARAFDATAPLGAGCEQATHGVVAVRLAGENGESGTTTLNPLRPGSISPTCAPGEVPSEGRCVPEACEPGFERVAGKCLAPVAEVCRYGVDPKTGACLPSAQDDWYVPSAASATPSSDIAALVARLKSVGNSKEASKDRVVGLLLLAQAYRQESGSAAASSRLRALSELTREAAFKGHRDELATYAELVTLSGSIGERSAHLDSANRMRERFPSSPETSVAYLTLARYYCAEGQPTAAERFLSQMGRNLKVSVTVEAEMASIRKNCARAKAAD
ncbi:MAG TPA: hypothetical protein VJV79_19410 [Polyangiaceae bacterium]|nr:hypothetical protein [Polyangiaceae bacterium]